MNNLHKLLQRSISILFLGCIFILPSTAQTVTFKIEGNFSAPFFENNFFVDLPAGASLQHNGDGVFQITNMPDVYGQYSLKMRTGGNLLNGVTSADISLIQRYILGNGALPTQFGLIAADVNCDGKISAKDMVDIRKAILGKTDKFDCNTNYTFDRKSLEFEWTGSNIDLGVYNPIKLGDVNGTASYNSESAANNSGN